MALYVWPLIFENEMPNIPWEILHGVWGRMVRENRAQTVFAEGTVYDAESWVEFLKFGGNLVVLVVDDERKEVCFVAWMNQIRDGVGHGHFCGLGPYRRGAASAVLDYWASWQSNGAPLMRLLFATIPVTNEQAPRLVKMVGFKEVGLIPKLFRMAHKGGELETARLFYYDFEEVRNGKRRRG